jgi:hypothetical protein
MLERRRSGDGGKRRMKEVFVAVLAVSSSVKFLPYTLPAVLPSLQHRKMVREGKWMSMRWKARRRTRKKGERLRVAALLR